MPQLKFILLFFIFSFCAVSLSAQTLAETAEKIRVAVENKNYQAAVGELEALKKSDRKVFEANNYDYLLARVAEKNGDFAAAMAAYQAVVNRRSVLSEYALRRLSQLARASGNLMLERIYLNRLLAVSSAADSLLAGAANSRLARSFFESKNFDRTIEIAEREMADAQSKNIEDSKSQNSNSKIKDQPPVVQNPIGNPQPNAQNPKARENLTLLGRAYLQSGNAQKAREIFTRLTNDLRDRTQPDDFALTAVKSLDEFEGGNENFGKTAPPIAEAEHLKRAFIYQFNREFALARTHYRAIVERYPTGGGAANALVQTGRSFAQEGNFNEAINWFERASAEFPRAPVAKDALTQAASAYARVGKPAVALTRYQTFIEKYPNAENLDRAYLNIVDVLRDQGEDATALKWTSRTQEVFRGKLPEAIALFAQARIRISQSDWLGALADLNALQNFADLGGARVPGGTNKPEIAFLRGFALENLNRYADAIDVYLSIADGRGEYYGWRATERLKALAANEASKTIAAAKLNFLLGQLKDAESTSLGDFLMSSAMQSVLRLTNNDELRAGMLRRLKISYEERSNKTSTSYRIPSFKLLDFGRKEILTEKRTIENQNYHRILADEFLFLGLYDEATPELERALTENGKGKTENALSADVNYTLAVFYRRGDMANRAVAFAEPLWKSVPADYQIELIPRDQIELLYPAPYGDALLKYAAEKNVDARFLLAIMRQESRFRADVKSVAAARGLMQFISTSADRIAGKLKRENFKQDDLYNPPTAILFGAQYLSDLFNEFPNQPQAVAASYNGGEDNVLRWLKRANISAAPDADRYVPEIVYAQSKDYVYKVLANYRVYQMFYDERLKAR